MEKIFLDPNIYYIENFILDEDIKIILEEYKNNDGWEKSGSFYMLHNFSQKTRNLLQHYKEKVELLINNENDSVNFAFSLSMFKKTEGEWAINPHPDRFVPESNIDYNDPHNQSTSAHVTKGYIIYFNDDYEGGEIVYLEKNITFRPKKGMILVHSGFPEYTHAVKAISSGERYMMTGFVYEKDFFENIMTA